MTPDRSDILTDDAPPYALAWAVLACAVAALTLAHPALSGGFLVNPRSDQYIAGFAFRDFAANSLKTSGQFPMWNPYLFGGMPYVDAMHGDIFYPTFLLRMLLPTDIAMTWGMILHFWFAGIAAYALFRAHRLSFYAALVGGIAYMMSGQIAGLVSPGHDGKLFISALFPLTLLVIRFGVRDGKRWAWGLLALIVGLGVLTPHPQLLQYLLLASGAYALWLAYFEKGEGSPATPVATRRLVLTFGAVMLGFAIGAIQFLPLRQYTPWSPRSAGHDWDTAVSYSMPPEEIINWVLPQFSGILDNYWGRNGIHFHSEYIGLPVLLLAAIGCMTAGARRGWKWFCVGLLVISALWAMGGFAPAFYHVIARIIPGTMYFRAPSTIMFETAFAVAALAALGVERLREGMVGRRFLVSAWVAVAFVSLLGVSGVLSSAFQPLASTLRGYPNFEPNLTNVTLGAWRMFFFGALALAIITAIALKRVPIRAGVLGLALVVIGDLWSIERQYWQFSPRAAQIYGSDAAIDAIRKDSIPGRVFTIATSNDAVFRDPFLNGDAMMSNAVRNVTGYHGNELNRYQFVYGGSWRGVLERLATSPAFPALTNLRWIYASSPMLPENMFPRQSKVTPVLGPITNAVGSKIWLFRLPEENPPAWVVPAVMNVSDAEALKYLTETDFPIRGVALFDPSSSVKGTQLTAIPAPLAIRARVTKYEPGSIDIELDAPAPDKSALVVSENYYPGWKAAVDGKPATLDRADFVVMGVPLTAGARKIELRFTDAAYTKGKMITLVALMLAVAAAIGGGVLQRRPARA